MTAPITSKPYVATFAQKNAQLVEQVATAKTHAEKLAAFSQGFSAYSPKEQAQVAAYFRGQEQQLTTYVRAVEAAKSAPIAQVPAGTPGNPDAGHYGGYTQERDAANVSAYLQALDAKARIDLDAQRASTVHVPVTTSYPTYTAGKAQTLPGYQMVGNVANHPDQYFYRGAPIRTVPVRGASTNDIVG